jgi:hypothetical protein
MLGLDVDVPRRRISLTPCLPAKVNYLRLSGVRIGADTLDVEVVREQGQVTHRLRHAPAGYHVANALPGAGLFG